MSKKVRAPERSRAAAVWLACVAALVVAMVVVGGATRLTGSGLSITEWKPISGALPPLSAQAWAGAFRNYQQIPQYRLVNRGITLEEFKPLFAWEWAHRLLGRLVGLVFFAPFVVLLATRRLPRRLIRRCVAILALGGVQGAVGWWMVASGLTRRVSVAPERLATHLGLALLILVACLWTGLEAWFGPGERGGDPSPGWRRATAGFAVLVFSQVMLGALVAGNKAGLVYNDWPRMDGRWFPAGYAGRSVWDTVAHSVAAVQFNHRIGAYVLFALALVLAIAAGRSRSLSAGMKGLAALLAGAVTMQAALGVLTLIGGDPLWLAILHQLGGVGVLALAVALAWRTRRMTSSRYPDTAKEIASAISDLPGGNPALAR